MRAQTSATLTVFVSLLFAGCSNSSDEGGSLPAPVNLSVTYYQSADSWNYTFNFNAVEVRGELPHLLQLEQRSLDSNLVGGRPVRADLLLTP